MMPQHVQELIEAIRRAEEMASVSEEDILYVLLRAGIITMEDIVEAEKCKKPKKR